MHNKNVSVIMATFNGANYIKKQIDSILLQTVFPIEIIICDDGSTDNTIQVINTYPDERIRLFVNDERLGVVENFKKAAKLAQPGNWLAFADQDDVWIPKKLERLIEAMKSIDDEIMPALVYSDLSVIDSNDQMLFSSFWEEQKIRPGKIRIETLLYGNVVTGCTTLINYAMARELFEMDANKYLHDEWMGMIAYTFGRVKLLNEKLVLYRRHQNNITFSNDYRVPGFLASLLDNFLYFIGKKKFLSRQFTLIKDFFSKYEDRLTGDQRQIFGKFIKLENRNYITQRVSRRITYQ